MTDLTRADKEAALAARIAGMRAKAARMLVQASQLRSGVSDDNAFWTQPAYSTAAGRAFSRRRDAQRAKMGKAIELESAAARLERDANFAEAAGVSMAGDALAAHKARIDACTVSPGMMVDTTHFGVRRVLKVNRITVLVEGAFGPLKVSKEYVRAVA